MTKSNEKPSGAYFLYADDDPDDQEFFQGIILKQDMAAKSEAKRISEYMECTSTGSPRQSLMAIRTLMHGGFHREVSGWM